MARFHRRYRPNEYTRAAKPLVDLSGVNVDKLANIAGETIKRLADPVLDKIRQPLGTVYTIGAGLEWLFGGAEAQDNMLPINMNNGMILQGYQPSAPVVHFDTTKVTGVMYGGVNGATPIIDTVDQNRITTQENLYNYDTQLTTMLTTGQHHTPYNDSAEISREDLLELYPELENIDVPRSLTMGDAADLLKNYWTTIQDEYNRTVTYMNANPYATEKIPLFDWRSMLRSDEYYKGWSGELTPGNDPEQMYLDPEHYTDGPWLRQQQNIFDQIEAGRPLTPEEEKAKAFFIKRSKAVKEFANKQEAKLAYTADPNAKASEQNNSVRDAVINTLNGRGDLATNLLEYWNNYVVAPIRYQDFGALGLNTLFNFMETIDTLGNNFIRPFTASLVDGSDFKDNYYRAWVEGENIYHNTGSSWADFLLDCVTDPTLLIGGVAPLVKNSAEKAVAKEMIGTALQAVLPKADIQGWEMFNRIQHSFQKEVLPKIQPKDLLKSDTPPELTQFVNTVALGLERSQMLVNAEAIDLFKIDLTKILKRDLIEHQQTMAYKIMRTVDKAAGIADNVDSVLFKSAVAAPWLTYRTIRRIGREVKASEWYENYIGKRLMKEFASTEPVQNMFFDIVAAREAMYDQSQILFKDSLAQDNPPPDFLKRKQIEMKATMRETLKQLYDMGFRTGDDYDYVVKELDHYLQELAGSIKDKKVLTQLGFKKMTYDEWLDYLKRLNTEFNGEFSDILEMAEGLIPHRETLYAYQRMAEFKTKAVKALSEKKYGLYQMELKNFNFDMNRLSKPSDPGLIELRKELKKHEGYLNLKNNKDVHQNRRSRLDRFIAQLEDLEKIKAAIKTETDPKVLEKLKSEKARLIKATDPIFTYMEQNLNAIHKYLQDKDGVINPPKPPSKSKAVRESTITIKNLLGNFDKLETEVYQMFQGIERVRGELEAIFESPEYLNSIDSPQLTLTDNFEQIQGDLETIELFLADAKEFGMEYAIVKGSQDFQSAVDHAVQVMDSLKVSTTAHMPWHGELKTREQLEFIKELQIKWREKIDTRGNFTKEEQKFIQHTIDTDALSNFMAAADDRIMDALYQKGFKGLAPLLKRLETTVADFRIETEPGTIGKMIFMEDTEITEPLDVTLRNLLIKEYGFTEETLTQLECRQLLQNYLAYRKVTDVRRIPNHLRNHMKEIALPDRTVSDPAVYLKSKEMFEQPFLSPQMDAALYSVLSDMQQTVLKQVNTEPMIEVMGDAVYAMWHYNMSSINLQLAENIKIQNLINNVLNPMSPFGQKIHELHQQEVGRKYLLDLEPVQAGFTNWEEIIPNKAPEGFIGPRQPLKYKHAGIVHRLQQLTNDEVRFLAEYANAGPESAMQYSDEMRAKEIRYKHKTSDGSAPLYIQMSDASIAQRMQPFIEETRKELQLYSDVLAQTDREVAYYLVSARHALTSTVDSGFISSCMAIHEQALKFQRYLDLKKEFKPRFRDGVDDTVWENLIGLSSQFELQQIANNPSMLINNVNTGLANYNLTKSMALDSFRNRMRNINNMKIWNNIPDGGHEEAAYLLKSIIDNGHSANDDATFAILVTMLFAPKALDELVTRFPGREFSAGDFETSGVLTSSSIMQSGFTKFNPNFLNEFTNVDGKPTKPDQLDILRYVAQLQKESVVKTVKLLEEDLESYVINDEALKALYPNTPIDEARTLWKQAHLAKDKSEVYTVGDLLDHYSETVINAENPPVMLWYNTSGFDEDKVIQQYANLKRPLVTEEKERLAQDTANLYHSMLHHGTGLPDYTPVQMTSMEIKATEELLIKLSREFQGTFKALDPGAMKTELSEIYDQLQLEMEEAMVKARKNTAWQTEKIDEIDPAEALDLEEVPEMPDVEPARAVDLDPEDELVVRTRVDNWVDAEIVQQSKLPALAEEYMPIMQDIHDALEELASVQTANDLFRHTWFKVPNEKGLNHLQDNELYNMLSEADRAAYKINLTSSRKDLILAYMKRELSDMFHDLTELDKEKLTPKDYALIETFKNGDLLNINKIMQYADSTLKMLYQKQVDLGTVGKYFDLENGTMMSKDTLRQLWHITKSWESTLNYKLQSVELFRDEYDLMPKLFEALQNHQNKTLQEAGIYKYLKLPNSIEERFVVLQELWGRMQMFGDANMEDFKEFFGSKLFNIFSDREGFYDGAIYKAQYRRTGDMFISNNVHDDIWLYALTERLSKQEISLKQYSMLLGQTKNINAKGLQIAMNLADLIPGYNRLRELPRQARARYLKEQSRLSDAISIGALRQLENYVIGGSDLDGMIHNLKQVMLQTRTFWLPLPKKDLTPEMERLLKTADIQLDQHLKYFADDNFHYLAFKSDVMQMAPEIDPDTKKFTGKITLKNSNKDEEFLPLPEGWLKNIDDTEFKFNDEVLWENYKKNKEAQEALLPGSIGTTGELWTPSRVYETYNHLPDEFKESGIVSPHFVLQESMHLFDDTLFSFAGLGTEATRFNPQSHTKLLINKQARIATQMASYQQSAETYLHTLFGAQQNYTLDKLFPFAKTDDELLQILKNNGDYVPTVLVNAPKARFGYKLRQAKVYDAKSLASARKQNAILLPIHLYESLVEEINFGNISHPFLQMWSRFIHLTKVLYLASPGTWLRNFVDSNLKAIEASGDPMNYGNNLMTALRLKKEYYRAMEILNRYTNYPSFDLTLLDKYYRKAARDHKLPLTLEEMKRLHVFYANAASGGESKILKQMWKKQAFDKYKHGFESFEDVPKDKALEVLEKQNIRGYDDDFIKFMNAYTGNVEGMTRQDFMLAYPPYQERIMKALEVPRIDFDKKLNAWQDNFAATLLRPMCWVEDSTRLAQYLTMEQQGIAHTQIFKSITDTHFNYDMKSNSVRYAELVLPFFYFEMENFKYWARKMQSNPAYIRALMHFMDNFSFDREDIDFEDYAMSESIQSQMLNGNIKLTDWGMRLKINASMFSAFNWLYAPPTKLLAATYTPAQMALRGALDMAPGFIQSLFDETTFWGDGVMEFKDMLNITPGYNIYDRYFGSMPAKYRERIPGEHRTYLNNAMISLFPDVFAVEAPYTFIKEGSTYQQFVAALEADGRAYDHNSGSLVDKADLELVGYNVAGSWEDIKRSQLLNYGKVWDNNTGTFVKIEDWKPDRLNQDYTGRWDDLVADMKRYRNLHWDANLRKFVKLEELTEGGLNTPGLTWDEIVELNREIHNLWWDANQEKFVYPEDYSGDTGLNRTDLTWDEVCQLKAEIHQEEWDSNLKTWVPLGESTSGHYTPGQGYTDLDPQKNLEYKYKRRYADSIVYNPINIVPNPLPNLQRPKYTGMKREPILYGQAARQYYKPFNYTGSVKKYYPVTHVQYSRTLKTVVKNRYKRSPKWVRYLSLVDRQRYGYS